MKMISATIIAYCAFYSRPIRRRPRKAQKITPTRKSGEWLRARATPSSSFFQIGEKKARTHWLAIMKMAASFAVFNFFKVASPPEQIRPNDHHHGEFKRPYQLLSPYSILIQPVVVPPLPKFELDFVASRMEWCSTHVASRVTTTRLTNFSIHPLRIISAFFVATKKSAKAQWESTIKCQLTMSWVWAAKRRVSAQWLSAKTSTPSSVTQWLNQFSAIFCDASFRAFSRRPGFLGAGVNVFGNWKTCFYVPFGKWFNNPPLTCLLSRLDKNASCLMSSRCNWIAFSTASLRFWRRMLDFWRLGNNNYEILLPDEYWWWLVGLTSADFFLSLSTGLDSKPLGRRAQILYKTCLLSSSKFFRSTYYS